MLTILWIFSGYIFIAFDNPFSLSSVIWLGKEDLGTAALDIWDMCRGGIDDILGILEIATEFKPACSEWGKGWSGTSG